MFSALKRHFKSGQESEQPSIKTSPIPASLQGRCAKFRKVQTIYSAWYKQGNNKISRKFPFFEPTTFSRFVKSPWSGKVSARNRCKYENYNLWEAKKWEEFPTEQIERSTTWSCVHSDHWSRPGNFNPSSLFWSKSDKNGTLRLFNVSFRSDKPNLPSFRGTRISDVKIVTKSNHI